MSRLKSTISGVRGYFIRFFLWLVRKLMTKEPRTYEQEMLWLQAVVARMGLKYAQLVVARHLQQMNTTNIKRMRKGKK